MDPRKKIFQLTVGDVCSTGVITVDHYQTMAEAASIFEKHDITGTPVVDELGKCIGIITAQDIVTFLNKVNQESPQSEKVRTFQMLEGSGGEERPTIENPFDRVYSHMSTAVQTVSAATKLSRASEVMCMEHIHRLVVLDESSRPVGMITSLDIVATLWNLRILTELPEALKPDYDRENS